MNIWVVTVFDGYDGTGEVYGVYSNLALAANAAMTIFNLMLRDKEEYFTFELKPIAWGYAITIRTNCHGDSWEIGEIYLGKMLLNE